MPPKHTRYFVSYRRVTDGPVAAQFAEQLISCVGKEHVFLDRDPLSLPAGISWPHQVVERVCSCNVLLPIIGPDWAQELGHRNRTGDLWRPQPRKATENAWQRMVRVRRREGSVVPDGTGVGKLRLNPTLETVGYCRVSLTGQ